METKSSILANQLVVMSRSDLDTMVNEMAQSIVAAQTRNMGSADKLRYRYSAASM